MSIIGTMSLAGTIALVFYYLVKFMLSEKHSAYCKMILLKISMFFYLCPFQLIKYLFPEDVISRLPENLYGTNVGSSFGRAGYLTVHNLFGEYISYPIWKIILIPVWMIMVLLFIVYELIQYFRLKNLLIKCSDEIDVSVSRTDNSIKKLERYLGQKKHTVQVLSSGINTSPFTIGIIKPIIFIPDVKLDGDEIEMIYQHEMTHIRNHDVLSKFLCLMIILIHWFNPFSYLVLHEFNALSEYCCDESVMGMRSMEDRKKYAILLVHFASNWKKHSKSFWEKCFAKGKNKKQWERRVGAILEMDKKKSRIVVVAAVMSMMLGTMTVYAYTTKKAVETKDTDISGEFLFEYESQEMYPDFSISDHIFVSEDGISYDASNHAEPYVLCTHIYETGYCYNHIKNDTGGCVIKKYNAQQCKKCKKIVVGTLIYTQTFVTCTH